MTYRIANFKVLAHRLTIFVTSIILYPRIIPKRIVFYVRIVKSAVPISVIVTPLVRFQNYFALIFLVTEWTDCESLMKATAFIRDEVQFYHAEPVVISVLKYIGLPHSLNYEAALLTGQGRNRTPTFCDFYVERTNRTWKNDASAKKK